MGAQQKTASQVVYSQSSEASAVTGESIVIPAGAAGVVADFAVKGSSIADASGKPFGGVGNTSLVLTSTAFTNEVQYGVADSKLANGDYYFDYVTGKGTGKKADASIVMTADYEEMISGNVGASGGALVELSATADTSEINPLSSQFNNSLVDVDTTNVTAATHYYPSATGATMDYYKDNSLSGKLIDADGTLTLTLEVTNDEDAASADWNTAQIFDDNGGALVANVTVTNGTKLISVSMGDMNYRRFRYKLVASGATNTVLLKGRATAL